MGLAKICFWFCAAGIAYAYGAYPIMLWCFARWQNRAIRRGPFAGSVSIILAARNEENRIANRCREFLGLLASSGIKGELIVVSDGSADSTAQLVRQQASTDERVRLIEVKHHVGKAEALSRASVVASGDLLVFADARQRWAADALTRLLENFADPAVGAVSGELRLDPAMG